MEKIEVLAVKMQNPIFVEMRGGTELVIRQEDRIDGSSAIYVNRDRVDELLDAIYDVLVAADDAASAEE